MLEAVEEKKLILHLSPQRPWSEKPLALWLTHAPKQALHSRAPLDNDFPCFSDGCPCPCLCFPKSSRSRFKNERYTSLDVLHTTSHCSRGAIVMRHRIVLPCSQTITPGSSWEQRLEKEGYDPENKQEETCYPCCAFFKTWPRQHNHGAQSGPWPETPGGEIGVKLVVCFH